MCKVTLLILAMVMTTTVVSSKRRLSSATSVVSMTPKVRRAMDYDPFLKCLSPKSPQCASYVDSCKYGEKGTQEVEHACVKRIAKRAEERMQVSGCIGYVDSCLAGKRILKKTTPTKVPVEKKTCSMNYQALGKCMVSKNAQCATLVVSSCGGTLDPKKLVDSSCVKKMAAKVQDKMHVKGCVSDLETCLNA